MKQVVQILGGLLFGGILFLFYREVLNGIFALLQFIESNPEVGSLLFLLFYILTCVLLLPGFFLTYAAGAIFGVPLGILLVVLGASLGATAAFLISRIFLRRAARRMFYRQTFYIALDQALEREGGRVILLARLCPFIPFRFSNYLFGITRIPFRTFLRATLFGILPSASVYVILGSYTTDIAKLAVRRPLSVSEWSVLGVGLIFFLVLLHTVQRLARGALHKAAPELNPSKRCPPGSLTRPP